MHHQWVCVKGRGDYLQQVHLRIFHSSKHCLTSDKHKQKDRLVNNIQWVLTGCYSLVRCSSQVRGWNTVKELLTMKSVKVTSVHLFWFFFAAIRWLHRFRIIQQGLLSLPLFHQLHATVGHE